MTIRGRFKNGQVVLDQPANVPDGTPARVEVEEAVVSPAEDPNRSVWDVLLAFAGKAEGLPADFAENHDHYIHGAPKRERQ